MSRAVLRVFLRALRVSAVNRRPLSFMFSSRFHWDFRPNRLTQLLHEKRASGARVLDLTESNPTHAGLDYPPEIVHAFAEPIV